ncbi:hypothetical protein ACFWG5_18685 [Streptomyces hydrogenans]|uniref:hypothetical protein n=1 Tax=Streptomyces hydrogenans TaxID=1873719 RepID=UPI00366383C8
MTEDDSSPARLPADVLTAYGVQHQIDEQDGGLVLSFLGIENVLIDPFAGRYLKACSTTGSRGTWGHPRRRGEQGQALQTRLPALGPPLRELKAAALENPHELIPARTASKRAHGEPDTRAGSSQSLLSDA